LDKRQQYEGVVGSMALLNKDDNDSVRFRVSIATYLGVKSFSDLLNGISNVSGARMLDSRLDKKRLGSFIDRWCASEEMRNKNEVHECRG
jgi:hypothetical protein